MKFRKVATLLFVALLTVITAACSGGAGSPTSPSSANSSLTGVLKSSIGDMPVVGANVSIVTGPKAGKSATTDSNGGYEIADLPQGEVRVQFSKEGFKTVEEVVNIPTSRREVVLPVSDPVQGNSLEYPIPATVLQPGEGMVFQASAFLVTRSGKLNFEVVSNRPGVRIDIYVFADEASAKVCKDIPEGTRGQGSLFAKACQGGGWTTTVLTPDYVPSIQLAVSGQGAVLWGVIKNTDPIRVPYTVSGKTVYVPS